MDGLSKEGPGRRWTLDDTRPNQADLARSRPAAAERARSFHLTFNSLTTCSVCPTKT
jgi:hypothetical protein